MMFGLFVIGSHRVCVDGNDGNDQKPLFTHASGEQRCSPWSWYPATSCVGLPEPGWLDADHKWFTGWRTERPEAHTSITALASTAVPTHAG
jgi:hypothetical protein